MILILSLLSYKRLFTWITCYILDYSRDILTNVKHEFWIKINDKTYADGFIKIIVPVRCNPMNHRLFLHSLNDFSF